MKVPLAKLETIPEEDSVPRRRRSSLRSKPASMPLRQRSLDKKDLEQLVQHERASPVMPLRRSSRKCMAAAIARMVEMMEEDEDK